MWNGCENERGNRILVCIPGRRAGLNMVACGAVDLGYPHRLIGRQEHGMGTKSMGVLTGVVGDAGHGRRG